MKILYATPSTMHRVGVKSARLRPLRALSLVETVIVLVLVGVVAAVAAPQVGNIMQESRDRSRATELAGYATSVLAAAAALGDYPNVQMVVQAIDRDGQAGSVLLASPPRRVAVLEAPSTDLVEIAGAVDDASVLLASVSAMQAGQPARCVWVAAGPAAAYAAWASVQDADAAGLLSDGCAATEAPAALDAAFNAVDGFGGSAADAAAAPSAAIASAPASGAALSPATVGGAEDPEAVDMSGPGLTEGFDLGAYEDAVAAALNAARDLQGSNQIGAVALDSGMSQMAREWAESEEEDGALPPLDGARTPSAGSLPQPWVRLGESAGLITSGDPQALVDLLMAAPAQRTELLQPDWDTVGVGAHVNDDGSLRVRLFFASGRQP